MTKVYGLDFETFSPVNLPAMGADNYRAHPDFQPILASIANPDGTVDRFDFVLDETARRNFLIIMDFLKDEGHKIAAHNVGFERGVLAHMGWHHPEVLVDSAVMARLLGAGSKLEVASRQLTNTPKHEVGSSLMAKFCWPGEGYDLPNKQFMYEHYEDWTAFGDYCDDDAAGSREIVEYGMELLERLGDPELWESECQLELLTYQQNRTGWKVDLDSLAWMAKRGWANSEIAKASFVTSVGAELNFKSPQQLKKFAADRGVHYKSLDKHHAPMVLEEVEELIAAETNEDQLRKYREVLTMLEIKLEIGGSTLTKIPTIQNRASEKGVVHDVYVHIGAGQTFRTTSLGVQMQNLSKLDKNIRDLETLRDYSTEWSNTDMGGQFRQVFTAHHDGGELIVGDFSAVESRGLAFLAGEQWKLDAYEQGLDVYKVLVTKYNNIEYDEVTSEMRPKGKYTELSCGYQAGSKAVNDLMIKYGFRMPLEETSEWVRDWRDANPNVVQLWTTLDDLLKFVVASKTERTVSIGNSMRVRMVPFTLPSLAAIAPNSTSLAIQLIDPSGRKILTRFVHGAYILDKGVAYYKAAESVRAEALWSNVNATATQKANKGKKKTDKKVTVLNTIYGGKLTGVLVQSFCRELFFDSLQVLAEQLAPYKNVNIVGQFHDEIIVDWREGDISLEETVDIMESAMSTCKIEDFPLTSEINHSYRYIK